VWQKLDGSTRLAAQVEDGKVVRIGHTTQSHIPQTLVQKALLPVLIGSAALLLLVIVSWPIGALQRWRAGRAGRITAGPLPWTGRLARAGAVAVIGAVTGMGALFLIVMSMDASGTDLLSNAWIVRPIQMLQWLGVVAIIPAAMDLFQAVRHRAGWRRIVMASLLLAGLLGMAWWAWAGNALSWDISV
jgi:beta-lactamase